jgi:TrmH family RNA methyltransferase
MTTITSPHNPHLQELRRLQRRRERTRSGRFLAEGEDLLAAAVAAGWKPVEGYRAAGSELGGQDFVDVEPAALAAVSTLGSGTRAIGVYEQRWSPRPLGPLCVYLHALSDPGNVGTVLRAAHAFGASCVALGPRCADPWSPKAVRASMGAIFHVVLTQVDSIAELPLERIALVPDRSRETRASGAGRFGDASGASVAPIGPRFGQHPPAQPLQGPAEGPVTLLVGAEREGLPAELIAACERVAYIPIANDSLNAAMAATIALYEMTRGWRSRLQAAKRVAQPAKGRQAGPLFLDPPGPSVPNSVPES